MGEIMEGDTVKHLVTGDEGTVASVQPFVIGSNKGEGYLVEVRGRQTFWLWEETGLLESKHPKGPEADPPGGS